MAYEKLMFFHLFTIIPCFLIGTVLLIIKKGTTVHTFTGRIYMVLMMFSAVATLFMPAKVGPTLFNHFGWIHALSLLAIYTVPTAWIAIKNNNVKSHKRKMILLYFGGLIVAGVFTFSPGRYMHQLFFGA